MNSTEKRSRGGYGLRRKVAKKRLDEDFEYYNAGSAPQIETSPFQDKQTHLVVVTKVINPQGKSGLKDGSSECLEKRPRGRPRKHQKSPTTDMDESVTLVSKEEEEEIEARLTSSMTELQEEEVSSLPEREKENFPEDGINLVSEPDFDERINSQMVNEETQEEYEHDLLYEEDSKAHSVFIMKRRKESLSHEDIQKLNQLNPDDKIECNECHKLLKPSSFRQHLRTHTGEKPFGCEVCEARFTRKGDVERHVRIVHNKQKPFKCSRCQRAFGDKKNLRWHLMNHDKKLFYVCEVCGFKFGKREYWENHVRFIHPVKGALDEDGNSSVQMEDESEDGLHTLTETCLGGEETVVQQKKSETIVSGVRLPLLDQEEVKVINIKTFSDLVKLSYSKKQENARMYSRANEQEGIEAVVIQVDEPYSESSPVLEQPTSDVIHVVNSSEVLPIAKGEEERFFVEAQSSKETPEDVEQKASENAQSPKMISFVLTDNNATTSEGNNASVQTLIEALLVAAKGDVQQAT